MAWNTPMTFVTGAALTAAQLNTYVSNNLAETAPAKATTSGRYFATGGANQIDERTVGHQFISASESTTSTSLADISGGTVGPSASVYGVAVAVVLVQAVVSNNTVNATSFMAADMSGATTVAAATAAGLRYMSPTANATLQASYAAYVPLSTGTTTYTAKYSVSSGTGTFQYRRLIVFPY